MLISSSAGSETADSDLLSLEVNLELAKAKKLYSIPEIFLAEELLDEELIEIQFGM